MLLYSSKRNIDYFTYIPLKPNDIKEGKFDRFNSLQLSKLKKNNMQLDSILNCKEDFSKRVMIYM